MHNEECLFPRHIHLEVNTTTHYVEINGRYQQVDNPPPGFAGPTARSYLRLDLRIQVDLGEKEHGGRES
jgi:hypothetical protein